MGCIAALYAGVAYIVGMVGFLFVVGWPDDPVQQVGVLVNNQVSLHILDLIVTRYGRFFSLSSHSRSTGLKAWSPALMQTATASG